MKINKCLSVSIIIQIVYYYTILISMLINLFSIIFFAILTLAILVLILTPATKVVFNTSVHNHTDLEL